MGSKGRYSRISSARFQGRNEHAAISCRSTSCCRAYRITALVPTAKDGLRGMRFAAAALKSNERDGAWTAMG